MAQSKTIMNGELGTILHCLFLWGHGYYNLYKVGRLKRAGRAARPDQQRLAKRILNAKPEGGRQRRRPKLRWEDWVENYVKTLGERNQKKKIGIEISGRIF
jgi:hypothetical protein